MDNNIETINNKSFMKKQMRKPLFWVVIVLFLYAFIGFIIAPFIVRSQIVDFIEQEYNRKSSMESVSVNPFTFSATINRFVLNEQDESIFLEWEEFYINLSVLPLLSKEISIDEIELSNPKITLIKRRTDFNFSDLIKPVEEEEEAVDSLIEEAGWIIILDKFNVISCNINFEDKSLDPITQLHIDSIDVSISNLKMITPDTANFKMSFKIREGGQGFAEGMFTQTPILAELSFEVDSISILPAQNYLSQFAHLKIDGAEANASGRVKVEMLNDSIPLASFKGIMGMNNLDLYDKLRKERFLSWNSVNNFGVEITYEPIALTIDSILIDGFYMRAAIEEDQSINVLDIFKPLLGEIDTTKLNLDEIIVEKPDIEYKIEIGEISIENSGMHFSDFSLPINFSAYITDLNGEILGIATGNPLGAIVTLSGKVDEFGFAKIEGNLDPFDPMNYTTMEMNFQNIDLTDMDGYSGKFVGYEIDKGAINLDLEYQIKKGMLTSNNQIFMTQLTLGNEVESEESLGPIVKLAIALLKDSDGNIDLDVEVEGDLNDPEINTGKLVWWAVKRSLTTIVTAPFRFLGNLLGISNSEELEYIEFEVADSSLSPPQMEKLFNITKALNERPGLKLGIYGAVDTIADKYAMQKVKFDSLFTLRLRKESDDQNITTATADQELRREILETMYVELYSDSLLNILISNHIESSDEEAESVKISADNIENSDIINIRDYFNDLTENLIIKQYVNREEFLALTSNRAQTIYNFLVIEQKVPKERLSIKGNDIYEYEDDDWVRCRLELEPMD